MDQEQCIRSRLCQPASSALGKGYAKHLAQLLETRVLQGLGEKVSKVLLTWDVDHPDMPLGNAVVPDKVELDVDELGLLGGPLRYMMAEMLSTKIVVASDVQSQSPSVGL